MANKNFMNNGKENSVYANINKEEKNMNNIMKSFTTKRNTVMDMVNKTIKSMDPIGINGMLAGAAASDAAGAEAQNKVLQYLTDTLGDFDYSLSGNWYQTLSFIVKMQGIKINKVVQIGGWNIGLNFIEGKAYNDSGDCIYVLANERPELINAGMTSKDIEGIMKYDAEKFIGKDREEDDEDKNYLALKPTEPKNRFEILADIRKMKVGCKWMEINIPGLPVKALPAFYSYGEGEKKLEDWQHECANCGIDMAQLAIINISLQNNETYAVDEEVEVDGRKCLISYESNKILSADEFGRLLGELDDEYKNLSKAVRKTILIDKAHSKLMEEATAQEEYEAQYGWDE